MISYYSDTQVLIKNVFLLRTTAEANETENHCGVHSKESKDQVVALKPD